MRTARAAFRPWSVWLLFISVPASYVVFTILLTAAVLATTPDPEIDDIGPSLYGFSIYWVVGSYILIPGFWVVASFLGMGIRRLRRRNEAPIEAGHEPREHSTR